ncbi:M1 family metallopeptidase [Sphingomonas sp. ASV193]|uniref:M1 family metallopeptidase n=1 Tax=Sphingomonas sp. ASV193 TaxID=3144405 RepID=UPI0032E913FA
MAGEARERDWTPWILIGVIVAVFAALAWIAAKHDRPLATRTGQTGFPLTREQASVHFDTADLTFEIKPGDKAIAGHAVLGFTVNQPIDKLQFDLDPELPISAIAADGTLLSSDKYRNDGGLVTVDLPAPRKAGDRLSLTIDYAGHPHVAKRAPWDGGFVWSHTKDGSPWVATAVEGEGCDLFWPCFDNSQVEVGRVTQHIIVPKGLSAPSNGRLLGVDFLPDGRTRWNWTARSPNNYAIAIDVAPYRLAHALHKSRFGNTIPLQYWYLPGEDVQAAGLLKEMGETLDFFEATVGPYPWGDEKMGVVETPHLGMEHQTINAYGNNYKLAPEGFDWLMNHEFSHEWFGNQLTNGDWDDMWLHEGFGSYMQPLTLEWLRGRMEYDAAMFKQRQTIANRFPIVSGRHQTEESVYQGTTGPGGDIYVKGSWVLHTLRNLIGDEPFWRSVRREVYGRPDPRPGNFQPRFGSTREFETIASQEAGRNLKWFFDVYLRRAHLPRLMSRRDGNMLTLWWVTPRGLPFPMPVDVKIDGKVTTVPMSEGHGSVAVPSPTSLVTLDPDNKILRQQDEIDRYRDDPTKAKASR